MSKAETAARELVAQIRGEGMTEAQIDEAARALARAHHIGDCEVWDMLADIDGEPVACGGHGC